MLAEVRQRRSWSICVLLEAEIDQELFHLFTGDDQGGFRPREGRQSRLIGPGERLTRVITRRMGGLAVVLWAS
jgi:hypothetical protein